LTEEDSAIFTNDFHTLSEILKKVLRKTSSKKCDETDFQMSSEITDMILLNFLTETESAEKRAETISSIIIYSKHVNHSFCKIERFLKENILYFE
jgi:hypothetical protein